MLDEFLVVPVGWKWQGDAPFSRSVCLDLVQDKAVGNVLFRIGKRWNSIQTYQEIGNITVNFEYEFTSNGTNYYSIYGWSKDPLIEFYIMENWDMPPIDEEKFGTISVDDSIYDMYKKNLIFSDISGKTLLRLKSIRRKKRNKGSVSVNEHFKAWEKYGFKLGKIYEVTFCVEGYKGYGNANVIKNDIIIN